MWLMISNPNQSKNLINKQKKPKKKNNSFLFLF